MKTESVLYVPVFTLPITENHMPYMYLRFYMVCFKYLFIYVHVYCTIDVTS